MLAACASTPGAIQREADEPATPSGWRLFRTSEIGFEFAYPEDWTLVVEPREGRQHWIDVSILPRDSTSQEDLDQYGEFLHTPRSVELQISDEPGPSPATSCSPGVTLTGGRLAGQIADTTEQVNAEKGYVGSGDGAEACLSDGKGRVVRLHMFPGAVKEDPEFLGIVRSFTFLPLSGESHAR